MIAAPLVAVAAWSCAVPRHERLRVQAYAAMRLRAIAPAVKEVVAVNGKRVEIEGVTTWLMEHEVAGGRPAFRYATLRTKRVVSIGP